MTAYIYTLSCPTTGQVRYVGKTVHLGKRLIAHIVIKRRSHVSYWVQSLLKQGLRPVIEVIEDVGSENWEEAEKFWIASLRFLGCDLTNICSGGRHGGAHRKGKSHTPETLAKIKKGQERVAEGKGMTFSKLQSLRGKNRWKNGSNKGWMPWIEEGISRSTWYTRRRSDKLSSK